ncbi:gag-protease polyprotein [Cucumis melo var. makuwa]|uniref:Gag-protease polyprotein n=1 Tax=Cucumis melo var. makuwa TaxID=1194695 RepID=A0A5A7SLL2_CUCMM|nr:gag-protease polyprotein [Cucumis melo var. makuwa]
MLSPGVSEVTLEFMSVTASVVGTNSPLFGWIRLDVELNKDFSYSSGTKGLEISWLDCVYAVEWCCKLNTTVMPNMDIMHKIDYLHDILQDHETDMCILRDHETDMCILWDHESDMCILRDHETDMCKGMARGRPARGRKDAEMPPRRGARRGSRGGRGRGAGRVQLEVQPIAQAIDPAAPVTHADLTAMEQRFRDLIMQMREQQQPAPPAPALALVVPQDDRTVEQYDAEFDMLSRFAHEMMAIEASRADKFVRGLRLDIQGLVRAFPPATHADALHLAVDLILQERANSSKVVGRGSTSG